MSQREKMLSGTNEVTGENSSIEGRGVNIVRNYQKELDKIIEKISACRKTDEGEGKAVRMLRLLLHACCAPCSSYCLEYLRQYFDLTVFYYNPNITQDEEYSKRMEEEKRLIETLNAQVYDDSGQRTGEDASERTGISGGKDEKSSILQEQMPDGYVRIKMIEGVYEPNRFYEIAKGLEQCPEGGERCFRCYEMRLRESAKVAAKQHFDYFTTTLTISPLKNAAKLNEIGERLGEEYGVAFLPSDFKKKNGYKRSIELSKEYHLYRQDYCGCVYSRMERERQKGQS